jgi:lysyl-tRNA synthetase, class I
MHWADRIVKEVIASGKYKPYWVDDMKTPSGYAHIGSCLGPIIHSCIYRALKDAGQKATLTYVFNDFDVADEFPPNFKEELKEHAGKVLKMIPSPVPGFENLADLLSDDLKKSLEYLGFEAKYISSWELYHQGKFDGVIKEALDSSEKIQDIYKKISGSAKKEQDWLPFQVICEKCGKLGTTRVFAWDGKEVLYKCEPNLVTWAEGCGYEGKTSPYGGNGKLPWKVDWSAHWKVIGVTIEGAGKDHASAGGSYDITMEICKKVFKYAQPFKFPYEFILVGGKKMSSSKGLGLKAHDLVNILPAEVARFLFVSADIKSQSNFDPAGTDAIPDLFDAYDKGRREHAAGSESDPARAFVLSQVNDIPAKETVFLPRFRDVAEYLQQSNISIIDKFVEVKGSDLTEKEKDVLEERIKYAKIWLEKYASEEDVISFSEELPKKAMDLSAGQREFLGQVARTLEKEKNPDKLQTSLYSAAKDNKLPTKDAFSAIYLSLIGKTHGPKAAWLMLQYPKDKVIKRFKEVSKK